MFFTGDEYFVYIIANATRVRMTNNLPTRYLIHRMKLCKGFTSNFHLCRLVYYEIYGSATDAINREKQLKRWRRSKKIALIEKANPNWHDLSDGWYEEPKGLPLDSQKALARGDRSYLRSSALISAKSFCLRFTISYPQLAFAFLRVLRASVVKNPPPFTLPIHPLTP